MVVKCDRCGREVAEGESFSHMGKTLCEDCYIEAGLHVTGCDPWATYSATHTREGLGLKGAEGLTELQKKVYEFVKSKGKVTREEVMASFNLSEADMDAQIPSLMHSELVKEYSEGDHFYLIPVS